MTLARRGRIVGDFHDADARTDLEHAVLPDETKIANRLTQVFRDALAPDPANSFAAECRTRPPPKRARVVAAAHPRLQHTGDLLEQLITRRVPAGVDSPV